MSNEDVILLAEHRDLEAIVRVCDIIFEDNSCKTVYFVEGYLLNNDGKTIENL